MRIFQKNLTSTADDDDVIKMKTVWNRVTAQGTMARMARVLERVMEDAPVILVVALISFSGGSGV